VKLPNHEQSLVPEQKIAGYLLSATHEDGRHKAQFFGSVGFSQDHWEVLAAALRNHAAENEVAKTEQSPFGTRYVIEGPLAAPDGRSPKVRSVWFVDTGAQMPRLVTAYPLQGNDQ
jgi:hypothetical protein